jgi:hypothetical protein
MPFKNRRQFRAMMAKGGKSKQTARRWAKKYGVPGKKRKR